MQVFRSARGRRRENMVGRGESGKVIVQVVDSLLLHPPLLALSPFYLQPSRRCEH